MKIIVDTNIIFSAILNTQGHIANLLMTKGIFEFYTPNYILIELSNHQNKLMKLLSIDSKEEIIELRSIITQNIEFIDEKLISKEHWKRADILTKNVDSDDIAFVALAFHLDGIVWTGDKKLKKGLTQKGYDAIIDTQKMLELNSTK